MSKYFDRFPITEYNGETVRNILAKVNLSEQNKRDIYAYYEFTLEEGLVRPDTLAGNYYNDPNFDWVFYLTNDVVDPYYSFYVEEDNFRNYIAKKYGSEENAREQILFYRNAWYEVEDSSISIDEYQSLDTNVQSYYKPIIDAYQQINRYERLKVDWIRSTNAIYELTLGSVSGFSVNQRIAQGDAKATIKSIDTVDNILVVQHVSNEAFQIGAFYNTTLTNVNIIHTAIPSVEQTFWVPVSAYEFELEENERKKNVVVLPKEYISKFDSDFREKLEL